MARWAAGAAPGGASASSAEESLHAPASSSAVAPAASSKLTEKPQQRKRPSSAASRPKKDAGPTTTAPKTTTKATPVGAPRAVAYPTRAGEVSGLPISAGGILALVAAIALFVLAALGLRRLSVGSEDAPRRPQVSSS